MTEHDYMNDPRMEEFRHLPYPVQEVRAWRLEVQDEMGGMTWEQKKASNAAMRKELEAEGFSFEYAEHAVKARELPVVPGRL